MNRATTVSSLICRFKVLESATVHTSDDVREAVNLMEDRLFRKVVATRSRDIEDMWKKLWFVAGHLEAIRPRGEGYWADEMLWSLLDDLTAMAKRGENVCDCGRIGGSAVR